MRQTLACLALALLSAACVPRVQKPGAERAAPALTDSAYLTADGKSLPLARWTPEGPPQAVVVAVHGFNDYRRAFNGTGAFLAERGILTLAYDQRGFGENEDAGIWTPGDVLADDLLGLLALVRAAHPDVPVYVLGMSMGGAVSLHALSRSTAPPDGVVLVAPAVWGWSTMNPFYKATLWLAAHTVRGWRPSGRSLHIKASDNVEMLRAQGRDPYIIKKTRIDAVYGLVGLMDDALEAAPKLKLPILLLYGGNDQIIPARSMQALRRRLGKHEYKFYSDGYHMLLRDLDGAKVLADVARWLEDGYSPSKSPSRVPRAL
ncbi:MAG: alpha/beta fold hydrolase [Elusimicrobiota bacterium]